MWKDFTIMSLPFNHNGDWTLVSYLNIDGTLKLMWLYSSVDSDILNSSKVSRIVSLHAMVRLRMTQ